MILLCYTNALRSDSSHGSQARLTAVLLSCKASLLSKPCKHKLPGLPTSAVTSLPDPASSILFIDVAGAYAISPVVERASSAQHLQLASGCPPAAYWAGSFAWDMTSHFAVTLLSLAIFAAYGDQAAVGSLNQVPCAAVSL